MKYLVAIGAFTFCFASVVFITVCIGCGCMLLVVGGWMPLVTGSGGEFPVLFGLATLLGGLLLGVGAGWHSYRATIRYYGREAHQ